MHKKGAFVIAGGSRGIAREIAKQAREAGYPIALIARSKKDLEDAKHELGDAGSEVTLHVADLTSPKQAARAASAIEKAHGSISVLVNNAATWTGGKTIAKLSRDDIQRSLDLNFFTAFNATQAVLSARKKSAELCIINMGATSSLQGWDGVGAFCLGKGALRTLSQTLARELQPEGVHVVHVIIDGLIDNTRTRHINPKLPKGRFMKMESIASTLLHLVHQERSCWTFELDMRPYNENW